MKKILRIFLAISMICSLSINELVHVHATSNDSKTCDHEWVKVDYSTLELDECQWVFPEYCKKCGETKAGGKEVHIGNHLNEYTKMELTLCGPVYMTSYYCDHCKSSGYEDDYSHLNHEMLPYVLKDCTGTYSDTTKCNICGYVDVAGYLIPGEYEEHEFSTEARICLDRYGNVEYGRPCIHENCQEVLHSPIGCDHDGYNAFKVLEGQTLTVETPCGTGERIIKECELCGYQIAGNWVDQSVFKHHYVPYTFDETWVTTCQYMPEMICDQCGEVNRYTTYHVDNQVVDVSEYETEFCGTSIITSYQCGYCGEESQTLDESNMHHDYITEPGRPSCQGYYSLLKTCANCGSQQITGPYIEPTASHHVWDSTSQYIETVEIGCEGAVIWGYKCLNDNCEDYEMDIEKTEVFSHHDFVEKEPYAFKEGCLQGTRIEKECQKCGKIKYEDFDIVGEHTFETETYFNCALGEFDNQLRCSVCGAWELDIGYEDEGYGHKVDRNNLEVINIDMSNPDCIIISYGYQCTHVSDSGIVCAHVEWVKDELLCKHAHVNKVAYKAPTYKAVGNEAYVTCKDCKRIFETDSFEKELDKAPIIEKRISSYVLGNINKDKDVDFMDAISVLKNSLGLVSIDDEQLFLGDVNNDDLINYTDAILILQKDAGIIADF